MAFLTDPFDSMALGPGIPPGWTPISGSGIVNSFANGGIWFPHQWYNFAGIGLTTPFFGPTRTISCFFGFKLIGLFSNNVFFKLLTNDLNFPPNQVELLRVVQEVDCSISIYTPGLSTGFTILIGNSGSNLGYGFPLNDWFYAQLNVSLTNVLVGAFWYFRYDIVMLVDSNLIISGSSIGLPDPQFMDGGLSGSGAEFGQFYGTIGISQVEFLTRQANNVFPDGGRTPFQRISQLPIEISSLVSSGNTRVSQLTNEIIKGKTSANVRISQLPIELMRKATTQPGGWVVSEA